MNLGHPHIESHLLGGRRNAVQKEHRNYTLSLMLYKRLCSLFQFLSGSCRIGMNWT